MLVAISRYQSGPLSPGGGGGGRGRSGLMGTHCQTAAPKFRGSQLLLGQKRGGSQLQSKNIIGTLAYMVCLYSLYFMKYMTFLI